MENFILEIPKWEGSFQFSYEIAFFLLICFGFIAGILFCFWGYKYFQTLSLVVIGCFCGYLGIVIANQMTQNPLLMMCFFVMFTFLGVCLLYLLSSLLSAIVSKFQIKNVVFKRIYLLTAISGAIVVSALVYFQIFHSIWVASPLLIVLAVGGSIYGKINSEKHRPFFTYQDIYRMKH